jgi:hypothetical protein
MFEVDGIIAPTWWSYLWAKHHKGGTAMSANESEAKAIYVFRCNDSALYAFTADSSGQILPSTIYPRINWRLERRVTLHRNHHSDNDKVITATLKAIVEYGFYLTHARSPLFSLVDRNPVGVGLLNRSQSSSPYELALYER